LLFWFLCFKKKKKKKNFKMQLLKIYFLKM
jgi:hypothetical protein